MRQKIIVKGLVQGVGYRYFTNKTANLLNISGFVRNLPNGDVEIEAQSGEASLNQLVKQLWTGPYNSHVRDVEITNIPEKKADSGFRVTY